jgi:hypothetical protein
MTAGRNLCRRAGDNIVHKIWHPSSRELCPAGKTETSGNWPLIVRRTIAYRSQQRGTCLSVGLRARTHPFDGVLRGRHTPHALSPYRGVRAPRRTCAGGAVCRLEAGVLHGMLRPGAPVRVESLNRIVLLKCTRKSQRSRYRKEVDPILPL